MPENTTRRRMTAIGVAAGAAALAAAACGGIAIANAQDDDSRVTGWDHHGQRPEPPDADAVEQATAAARTAVPDGQVEHVMPLPGGGFAVAMIKADDSRVAVLLDSDYAVTAVKDAPAAERPEAVTGADARKARSAARKAVRRASVERVMARPEGGYAVMVHKPNGNPRLVLLDEEFTVEDVVAAPGPGGRHGAPLTGKSKQKAEDAARAEVPGGKVVGSHAEPDGYDVLLRTDEGIVKVELDRNFTVTEVSESGGFPGPHGGPGEHGPGGPWMGPDGPSDTGSDTDSAAGADTDRQSDAAAASA